MLEQLPITTQDLYPHLEVGQRVICHARDGRIVDGTIGELAAQYLDPAEPQPFSVLLGVEGILVGFDADELEVE